MKFHPIADCFPLLEGPDFQDFKEDIREHGVRQPVVLYEGMILDGRNRWRAAQAARVSCPTQDYEGDDPIAFVTSLNLKRRHLSDVQLAFAAEKLANLGEGRPGKTSANDPVVKITIPEAAEMVGVSEIAVKRARAVARQSEALDRPDIKQAVESGTLPLHAAVIQLKQIAEAPKTVSVVIMPPDEPPSQALVKRKDRHPVLSFRKSGETMLEVAKRTLAERGNTNGHGIGLEVLTPELYALILQFRDDETEYQRGKDIMAESRLASGKTLLQLQSRFEQDGYSDFWAWFRGRFHTQQHEAEQRMKLAKPHSDRKAETHETSAKKRQVSTKNLHQNHRRAH